MKPFGSQLCCIMLSSALLVGLSQAQTAPTFDTEIQQGNTQLAVGNPENALNAAEAAIRIDPQSAEGYALEGRALLALRRYEEAADALSRAIERAPAAEQGQLRELRRDGLLAESGALGGGPPPAASAGAVASIPAAVPEPPAAAPAPPPPAPPVVAAAVPAAPAVAAAPSVQATTAPAPRGGLLHLRRARPAVALDPADAAWVDASSGLMWAKPWYYPPTTRGPWSYRDATAFCANLQILGHTDWRLPTLDELQGLYLVSSKGWRWSVPKFDAASGFSEALKSGLWRLTDFNVGGDSFNGDRLLVWSSSPGDADGAHAGVYFGRGYSVADDMKTGVSFPGESRRNPFQGYAFCVRKAN